MWFARFAEPDKAHRVRLHWEKKIPIYLWCGYDVFGGHFGHCGLCGTRRLGRKWTERDDTTIVRRPCCVCGARNTDAVISGSVRERRRRFGLRKNRISTNGRILCLMRVHGNVFVRIGRTDTGEYRRQRLCLFIRDGHECIGFVTNNNSAAAATDDDPERRRRRPDPVPGDGAPVATPVPLPAR